MHKKWKWNNVPEATQHLQHLPFRVAISDALGSAEASSLLADVSNKYTLLQCSHRHDTSLLSSFSCSSLQDGLPPVVTKGLALVTHSLDAVVAEVTA